MNSIPTEQNTERQLRRLAAQRQLYATAKKVFGMQLVLSGPVAVTWASVTFVCPVLKGYGALWGIAVTLLDLFWLTPWQKRLRDSAARIQELFDCEVLSLSWNELKAGKRPDPELVKEQATKYQTWAATMPPVANWYGKEVEALPLHVARIACQRSNCWWDAKQRRRYAVWVIFGVVVIFAVVLAAGLKTGLTLEDFILKVVAPLAPALVLGIRQVSEQMDTANRLDKLKEHAERLWDEALNGSPETEITLKTRNLQDEILENRKRGAMVFDWVFKRLRSDYETQMNHGVAEFVVEAKQRLGLTP